MKKRFFVSILLIEGCVKGKGDGAGLPQEEWKNRDIFLETPDDRKR
jgi:hypothetical protein